MKCKASNRRLHATLLAATCCIPSSLAANSPQETEIPAAWGFEDPEMFKRGGRINASDQSRIAFDSVVKRTGEHSLRIERTGEDSSRVWIDFSFPHDRREGDIEFSFYLRGDATPTTVNLISMIRSGMGEQEIQRIPVTLEPSGDWTKAYAVVPVDAMDLEVDVGVEFPGEGRVWVDDFSIRFGGEPYGLDPQRNWGASKFASGSGVALDHLTPRQSADVAVLAKVWGFLKYHHPTGQSGERNWDDEFLELLGAMLESGSPQARDRLILEWVQSLGEIPQCTECAGQSSAPMLRAPDTQSLWSDIALPELRQALEHVYKNRARNPHQVFAYRYAVGQAHFSNELSYRDMNPDDDGFRLLAVARYWNMVQYWFPYRDLIDEPWEPVLDEALRDVVRGEGREAYIGAMRRLIARVDDTHALMYTDYALVPPAGACFPQPHVSYVEGVPLIVDTGGVKQVAVGDRVVAVDGSPVGQIEAKSRPYYASSNPGSYYRDLGRNLLRGECGSITLELQRGTGQMVVELPRNDEGWRPGSGGRDTPARGRGGPALQWLDNSLLYISLDQLVPADLDALKARLATARAAVFDVRGYGQVSIYQLLPLLAQNPTVFAGFSTPNMETPGEFVWQPQQPIEPSDEPALFAGPIAILVDENTQSAAEFATMALQSVPGSFVVGSTTAGADGNVTRLSLPGGLFTAFSGIGVFYPDKTPTQQVGIRIDYPVSPTIAGVTAGADEQLDHAISLIDLRLLAISGQDKAVCTPAASTVLALDEDAFDQYTSGGWRPLSDAGCYSAAADLIAAWRARHGSESRTVIWHEAQMRAFAGDTADAVELMHAARVPDGEPDRIGWNHYVDGTIAFLTGDRSAFEQNYAALSALPVPAEQRTQVPPPNVTVDLSWPPNLGVLDCFRKNWGQKYAAAYSCGKFGKI